VGGRTYIIRINDFPAEPLYTLLIDGKEVEDLEDWPSAWVRQSSPDPLLDLLKKTPPPE
jgi:hypothetical protein